MGVVIAFQGQLADPGQVDEMVREVRAFAEHMNWRSWTVAELVAAGHLKDTGPDTRLRGITVQIDHRCDSVHFHIDRQGRFVNHWYHKLLHIEEERQEFLEAMRASSQWVRVEPGSEPDGSEPDGSEPDGSEPDGSEPDEPPEDPPRSLDEFLSRGLLYNWTKTQHGGPAMHVQACTLIRFVRDRFAPDLRVKDDTGYFEHGRLEAVERDMALVSQAIHLVHRATDRISDDGGVSDAKDLLDKLQRYINEERKMLH